MPADAISPHPLTNTRMPQRFSHCGACMMPLLPVEMGGVVVSVGCGTVGNAGSGTGQVTGGTSRKAGLSQLILSVHSCDEV